MFSFIFGREKNPVLVRPSPPKREEPKMEFHCIECGEEFATAAEVDAHKAREHKITGHVLNVHFTSGQEIELNLSVAKADDFIKQLYSPVVKVIGSQDEFGDDKRYHINKSRIEWVDVDDVYE